MTAIEASKGVRKFLRGQGGADIDFNWFERAGAEGREALFHTLLLSSTSARSRGTIKALLIAFFFDADVEKRLLDFVHRHSDPRVREIDERVLRNQIAHRTETRNLLIQMTSRPNRVAGSD